MQTGSTQQTAPPLWLLESIWQQFHSKCAIQPAADAPLVRHPRI